MTHEEDELAIRHDFCEACGDCKTCEVDHECLKCGRCQWRCICTEE